MKKSTLTLAFTLAFTLVELLVVIAIIAILASLSLPVYTKVMERGRSVQDANNLKQIATGIIAYLGDNDDVLFSGTSTGTTTTSWAQTLIANYVPDPKVFQSPFDRTASARTSGTNSIGVSYGINSLALTTNVGKWMAPTSTIVVSPAPTSDPGSTPIYDGKSDKDTKVDSTKLSATTYLGTHASRKKINAVFYDAHVQANMAWKDYCPSTDPTDTSKKNLWDPLAQ
jgi:prepilin-type N-terminal cleavage/methylation domain-containing protein